jgi:tetratricopeptide (TPR) repeat protein
MNHALRSRHVRAVGRLGSVVLASVIMLAGLHLSVHAAPPAQRTDRLSFTSLTSNEAGPANAPAAVLRFNVQLNYDLQTAQRAFLLVFLFENNAKSSSQDASDATWINAGTGQVSLDVDYVPTGDTRNVTLIVGLFRDAKNMLTSAATTPLSLSLWRGRASFEAAMAARIAGDHREAIDALTFAIELSPDFSNLYYWRADSFVRLEKYDEAILDYREALALEPNDRASRVGLGVALLWKDNYRGAIDELTRVIDSPDRLDKWTAWALRARGVAHAALGQRAESIDNYEAYLALAPTAPDRAEVEGWIADLRAQR